MYKNREVELDRTTEDYRDSLLMPVEEVAQMLRISVRSVWRLVSTNAMPQPRKLRGSVRWSRLELEKWVEEGCPVPNNDRQRKPR